MNGGARQIVTSTLYGQKSRPDREPAKIGIIEYKKQRSQVRRVKYIANIYTW